MMKARFDKRGRQLPDTGRGCGCRLCEEANAPRYERRADATRGDEAWSPLQRRVARLVHAGMLSMQSSIHRRGLA